MARNQSPITFPNLQHKVEAGTATNTEAKMYHRSNNEARAGNVCDILRGRYDRDDDDETKLTDLLSDIRHFCDVYGVDYAVADRADHNHYTAEVAQAQTGVAR